MRKCIQFVLLFCWCSSLFSQEEEYNSNWADQEYSPFFVGVNVGAFFANNNTAELYSGSPAVTRFGIPYVLGLQANEIIFRDFFVYPFEVADYPIESVYRTAVEIGLHLGYKFNKNISVYSDVNTTQLSYEQSFTIAIDDPNNQMIGPTFQQFPIFGEETRINVNLGTQLSLYADESTTAYYSVFGNFNAARLEDNYFVIDGRTYNIFHTVNNVDRRPGGAAFGFGSGLGVKFHLTENVLADLTYNLYYTKINMTENIQPFGVHHTIGLRVIWSKLVEPND